MAALWEGVPASPCSAASDDHPETQSNPSMPPPKRHLNPDQPPCDADHPWKRIRLDQSLDSIPVSASVEFVEATTTPSHDSNFVSRLNNSAQDERRNALLQRLKDIDQKKKNLHHRSPTVEDDDIILVEEKSIIMPRVSSPSDVKAGPSASVPTPKQPCRRPPPKKKATRAKSNIPVQQPDVIIVDDDSSSASLPPRPTPKSSRAKKSVPGALKSLAAKPTRASSRVRRPRTLSNGQSESGDLRLPTPSCMSKCKRFQFCKKLTNSLLKNSAAAPFSAPVKDMWALEDIPRYFDIITSPMDLSTIKKNLEFSVYVYPCKDALLPYRFDVDKYAEDMRLIFRNAMVYNRNGDLLFVCARSFLADFDRAMSEDLPELPSPEEVKRTLNKKRSTVSKGRKERSRAVIVRIDSDHSSSRSSGSKSIVKNIVPATARIPPRKTIRAKRTTKKTNSDTSHIIPDSLEELSERLTYLRNSRTAVLARAPTPKGSGYLTRAALLYKVEISHSQKCRCRDAITNGKVPTAKMEILIDIMKAAVSPDSTGDDDDFELEFDKLDNETWRNLEAFLEQYVPGFKTIRHSTLGREFTSVKQVDLEIEEIQVRMKKLAEITPVDEDDESGQIPKKTRSFFENDAVDDSSSDEDSDSGSDSSDSDSDAE